MLNTALGAAVTATSFFATQGREKPRTQMQAAKSQILLNYWDEPVLLGATRLAQRLEQKKYADKVG